MYLLLDIGRTKFRLARSLDGETLSAPEIIPTPETIEEGVKKIVDASQASDIPIEAMVIGASRKVWTESPLLIWLSQS